MGLFDTYQDTLFTDKDVLEEGYAPDEILERDAEVEEYTSSLKDILFDRSPPDIFLYGKAGVGKTAVTEYVLQELAQSVEETSGADELHILKRNCNDDTVHSVLCYLINTLRTDDQPEFPARGKSRSEAYNALYDELDSLGGTFLIVLDEIDHLRDADSFLYEIPRARANDYIENARVGIIGISNNYQFRQQLSAKVKDSLQEDEISFATYDANELRTILRDRAEKGLKPDAWTEGAIAKAAALAARDSGSARQAIDVLREGTELAERDDASEVTEAYIDEAQDRVRRGRLRKRVRDQSQHGQLVLEAIARLEVEGKTPCRSKEIKRAYERTATDRATEPLTTLKSVQNHLSDLSMLGFLSRFERNEGRSGGVYHEYELNLDPEAVFDVREEIEAENQVGM
jgi:orc1/cdc6 family replication initiation protein